MEEIPKVKEVTEETSYGNTCIAYVSVPSERCPNLIEHSKNFCLEHSKRFHNLYISYKNLDVGFDKNSEAKSTKNLLAEFARCKNAIRHRLDFRDLAISYECRDYGHALRIKILEEKANEIVHLLEERFKPSLCKPLFEKKSEDPEKEDETPTENEILPEKKNQARRKRKIKKDACSTRYIVEKKDYQNLLQRNKDWEEHTDRVINELQESSDKIFADLEKNMTDLAKNLCVGDPIIELLKKDTRRFIYACSYLYSTLRTLVNQKQSPVFFYPISIASFVEWCKDPRNKYLPCKGFINIIIERFELKKKSEKEIPSEGILSVLAGSSSGSSGIPEGFMEYTALVRLVFSFTYDFLINEEAYLLTAVGLLLQYSCYWYISKTGLFYIEFSFHPESFQIVHTPLGLAKTLGTSNTPKDTFKRLGISEMDYYKAVFEYNTFNKDGTRKIAKGQLERYHDQISLRKIDEALKKFEVILRMPRSSRKRFVEPIIKDFESFFMGTPVPYSKRKRCDGTEIPCKTSMILNKKR